MAALAPPLAATDENVIYFLDNPVQYLQRVKSEIK